MISKMKKVKIYFKKIFIKIHLIISTIILFRKFFNQKKSFEKVRKTILNADFNLQPGELIFVDSYWVEIHKKIISDNPRNHFYFLNMPALVETMSGGHFKYNYEPIIEISKKYLNDNEIRSLLKENPIGGPRILINSFSSDYGITSLNKVVHLYQLSLLEFINTKMTDLNFSIVEWGGGFGGLAFLAFKKYPDLTYTIIDVPASIMTQYLYLSTLLGDSNVNLVDNGIIIPGKINLVRLSKFQNIKYDCHLFISSWAISESNSYSQEIITNNNFFNSKYGILIHQKASDRHRYAENLNEFLVSSKKILIHEELSFFKDQFLIIWEN